MTVISEAHTTAKDWKQKSRTGLMRKLCGQITEEKPAVIYDMLLLFLGDLH